MPAHTTTTHAGVTMDLTTATPSEVDTALAAIYEEIYDAQATVRRILRDIDVNERRIARGSSSHRAEDYIDRLQVRLDNEQERVLALYRSCAPYNEEFVRRGGWTRAWLVDNKGGHVHSSMDCSTCFERTQFGWLPQVSGLDESEIVAQAGEGACTICYPSAPAEVLNNPCALELPKRREERLAREADKVARQVAKAAKSLSIDGSVVTVRWDYDSSNWQTKEPVTKRASKDFKTYRGAELWVVEQLVDGAQRPGYDHAPREVVAEVIGMMAAKKDEEACDIRSLLVERADKKRKAKLW